MVRCFLLVVLLAAPPAAAQVAAPADTLGLDVRLLHAVYGWDNPAAVTVLRGAEWSSTRVFMGSIPVAWGATWLAGGASQDFRPAYRLTVSHLGTYGAVYALKYSIRRERPFRVRDEIEDRTRHVPLDRPSYSFPSGHASLAFTIATSVSLSFPEWYVVVPAAGWASAVALARPHHGVHYPSDILVGAVLGTGVAVLVHTLGDAITPAALRPDAPPDAVVVPLVLLRF